MQSAWDLSLRWPATTFIRSAQGQSAVVVIEATHPEPYRSGTRAGAEEFSKGSLARLKVGLSLGSSGQGCLECLPSRLEDARERERAPSPKPVGNSHQKGFDELEV